MRLEEEMKDIFLCPTPTKVSLIVSTGNSIQHLPIKLDYKNKYKSLSFYLEKVTTNRISWPGEFHKP